jgi:hypothetical protein
MLPYFKQDLSTVLQTEEGPNSIIIHYLKSKCQFFLTPQGHFDSHLPGLFLGRVPNHHAAFMPPGKIVSPDHHPKAISIVSPDPGERETTQLAV